MLKAKSKSALRSVRTAPLATEKPLGVVIGVPLSEPIVIVSIMFACGFAGRSSSPPQAAAAPRRGADRGKRRGDVVVMDGEG